MSAPAPVPAPSPAGEDAEVAAHILQLFHLLPRVASRFLETREERLGLVVLTIELEEKLPQLSLPMPAPHVMWSPYRSALTRFLNKYPAEAVVYFLDPLRLAIPSYFTRLLDIIRHPIGRPLLEQLAESEDRLLAVVQHGSGAGVSADGE